MAQTELERKAYKLTWSRRPENRERRRLRRLETNENRRMAPAKRRSYLRKRYGISDEIYFEMLAAQGGGCAVCQSPEPGNGKSGFFDVDHDHETGFVRGLLCRLCNITLGVLEKHRARLEKLDTYRLEAKQREQRVKEHL